MVRITAMAVTRMLRLMFLSPFSDRPLQRPSYSDRRKISRHTITTDAFLLTREKAAHGPGVNVPECTATFLYRLVSRLLISFSRVSLRKGGSATSRLRRAHHRVERNLPYSTSCVDWRLPLPA